MARMMAETAQEIVDSLKVDSIVHDTEGHTVDIYISFKDNGIIRKRLLQIPSMVNEDIEKETEDRNSEKLDKILENIYPTAGLNQVWRMDYNKEEK